MSRYFSALGDYTNLYPNYPSTSYYRVDARWPPPEPKPVLYHHPSDPYFHICGSTAGKVQEPFGYSRRLSKECSSSSHNKKRRHVHFADHPIIINLPVPKGHPTRSAPKPIPTPPRGSATTPTPTATKPNVSATAVLHDLLTTFPHRLWDMRRRAKPTFEPHYEPRYAEPMFPHDGRRKSIKLFFAPCSHTEFSWITKVKASNGSSLTVEDVLRAISTELYRRSACRDLYAGHPCHARAQSARRLRTRHGYSDVPRYDDAVRNVDLYHVDRGQALYFRGLKAEQLRSGEVVYLVKFSYA